MPIRFDLELPFRSGRPRIAVVDKSDTVTNEYFRFDYDTLANEGVTADFATFADFCSLLDLNERANSCLAANLASIKVYESVNSHVATELHIWRNPLIIREFVTHTLIG